MSERVFFYDDQDVVARHNLHLVPGPVRKLGPANIESRSCDLQRESCFAGSVVLVPDGGYRLYYSGGHPDEARLYRIAMAESADGMTWTKPDLGQMEFEGADTNWLWPEGMPDGASITQPQVVLLPDGSWRMWFWWHGHEIGRVRYIVAESDDGIRWQVIDLDMPHIMHPSDLELGQAGSAVGLTEGTVDGKWSDQRTMDWMAAKRLRSNDATYVYYNEEAGKFEMYSVWLMPVDEASGRWTPHDNAPQVLRTIHRRESEDAIAWSDPEMLILADEHDPMHQEFYYLAVQPDGDWNIGMVGHYRCWEQTMDLELCFSRDTHHWMRPLRGGWVPRGGIEEIDYMSVYATSRLIDRGDSWLLLYRGGNAKHNRDLPEGVTEPRQAIMAAEAPKGRFAGLQATERMVGSLTLNRFNQSAEQITVDADVRGRLQAELRDPYGRPIAGYELNSCIPITGDSACHVLTWEGGALAEGSGSPRETQGGKTSAAYRYDVVGLRIEIEDGTIYSVER